MEEPVTIVDREVLKVLAVDTRMDILKELSESNRTPSDLGKKLKKSDATIVEHLEKLEKADLVKRIEQPGKKWVFYTLTDRGYGIIKSKSRKLVIILALSSLALVGGAFNFLNYFHVSGGYSVQPSLATGIEKAVPAATPFVSQFPISLYISIALFAISVIGFSFYFIKKSKE